MEPFIQIQWTAPNIEEARRIIQLLLEQQIIACASILPEVESWYVWEGAIETEHEVKVLLKTIESNAKKAEQVISENHTYECPEILCFRIEEGFEPYLNWIASSTVE